MDDWNGEHLSAFRALQEEANKEVIRYHPDFEKDFVLETDASNTGVGAILYQLGQNNEKLIIKPLASKLTKSEVNWGITEKEVYAVVWAVEKLAMYLLGRKFHIITDHKAAQWIKEKSDFGNARIQRWLEKLQYFDFTIEYRSGDQMYEADALSRMYKPENEDIVATEEQLKIIKEIHENVGHRATDVTEYAIKKQYTSWNYMKNHISNFIKECETCIRNKVKSQGGSEFIETERKLQKIGIDILEYNNEYILVGIDYYTRRIWASVIKSKNGSEIVEVLTTWFKRFGNPEELVMDQGLEFSNAKMEELCLRRNIKMHRIATDHHKSNGRVERVNRTLREYFRKDDENMRIEERLGRAIQRYNNSLHSAIKMSPLEAWNCGETEDLKARNKKLGPYAKTYKKLNRDKFIKGQIVAVKKLPYHKEDKKFSNTGEIVEELENDTYLIKCENRLEKRNQTDLNLIPFGLSERDP